MYLAVVAAGFFLLNTLVADRPGGPVDVPDGGGEHLPPRGQDTDPFLPQGEQHVVSVFIPDPDAKPSEYGIVFIDPAVPDCNGFALGRHGKGVTVDPHGNTPFRRDTFTLYIARMFFEV